MSKYNIMLIKDWKAVKGLLFLLLLISVSIDAVGQRGLPPLDFEQFRKDVRALSSPEEKLNRYIQMSLKVMRSRPDSLFAFAEEIQDMQGLKPEKREAFARFMLANGWRATNRDSAIYYATKAANQLKKLGEHEQYLRTTNLLGLEYQKKSNYPDAESAYLKGLDYSQEVDSPGYPIHYFYGNLGNLYSSVGANGLAVQMFEKFMEYADNPGDRCNIKSRLAKNLMNLNDLERAEQMLSPCLEYDLPPPIQAITRSNLSEIANKMGKRERSLSLMEEAASISTNYRIPNLHNVHLVRLGNKYLEFSKVNKADSIQALIASSSFRRMNRDFRIKKVLFLANLSLSQERFSAAVAYSDSALIIAENEGLLHLLGDVYKVKAKAYEKMDKLDLAVENLQNHDKLREKMDSRDAEKNLAMMKVRYQLQNKEEELALINTQLDILNTRNVMLLAIVIGVVLLGGFIYGRYRESRFNEETITSELKKRDVTIHELRQKIKEHNQRLKTRDIPKWVEFNSQLKLALDEIRYIQSDGNYVKIFLSDEDRAPLMERLTLKECEGLLPDDVALRIHRSTIVNIRHVSHINNQVLFLKDNTQLKISRRYKKELVNLLSNG